MEAPKKWFKRFSEPQLLEGLGAMKITEAFLAQARRAPDEAIIADQIAGVKTYRDMVTAVTVLKQVIERWESAYVGIMMPASVAANILYLAVLFAGKIPVMINWTLGRRNLKYSVDSLGLAHILTSRNLIGRVQEQGIELEDLSERFVCLEDIGARLSGWRKLRAALGGRFSWKSLYRTKVAETAVVLFTSGSESLPKAVPLTHRNILSNLTDAYECFSMSRRDSLLGILPPFHSFGLTVSMLLPICLGLRAVYYPHPTHGRTQAAMIEAYKVSILVGTPTFLNGIIRTCRSAQLTSLRLVISGAEKCPQRTYEALARKCPQTIVLEGYGVTECAPVISNNHEDDPYHGTIGKVMSSLEYALVDPETNQRAEKGREGMLLVRGPSVFEGYLNYDGVSPFVTLEDKQWYCTGDVVREDGRGNLVFVGRLRRFVKLGGEMISLPAIEAVLGPQFNGADDKGPVLAAVDSVGDDRSEIVLFATKDIERSVANGIIRRAGLSPLHNIRRVIRVDELPVLGTGKTDYRALRDKLLSLEKN